MNKYDKIRKLAERPLNTEEEVKRVEIIILTFNNDDTEVKALEHLIRNTSHPYKLNLYDNTANPIPGNISKIWNRLIRESTCPYVCIMDSDVFVPENWLTKMMDTMKRADVVVPLVSDTSCNQQLADKPGEGEEELKELLAGQIVLYDKKIFEKVGMFDEEFLLYGQDTEWGMRMASKDVKCLIRKDVLVEHKGSDTIEKNKDKYPVLLEREYARMLCREKGKKTKKSTITNILTQDI